MATLSSESIQTFQKKLADRGHQLYRPMPWRENTDPYWVLISEVMLQQTQVDRVIVKFEEFIQAFPTVASLADASFAEVLSHWSGLGYNRRALWLHESVQVLVREHNGEVPSDAGTLTALKGIGPNTASAICVYAFAQPHVFIETNVRAVFIHEFFQDRDDVHDDEIRELVNQTLDREDPRAWYWAVMDYGTFLKKSVVNPARRSAHHSVQSRFEGSRRQIRGQVLKSLLHEQVVTAGMISTAYDKDVAEIESILGEMERDGLLVRDQSGSEYRLRS